jgi:hypothetical protein
MSDFDTYDVYTVKRGRRGAAWRKSGTARQQNHGCIGVHVEMVPVTGFSGFVYLVPRGKAPPPLHKQPEIDDDENDEHDITEDDNPRIN